MAKIDTSSCSCNSPTHNSNALFNDGNTDPYHLDTLAQLVTNPLQPINSKGKADVQTDSITALQKRAIAKRITMAYLFSLVDLDSPLLKSYWQTYHCANMLFQDGDKITSRYCNQRWCIVCNRIRIAKLVNGYKHSIDAMENPWFVTLTIQSIPGRSLKRVLSEMQIAFKRSTRNLKKTHGVNVIGLRKLECNYNPNSDTYNPHYHVIVEGCKSAFYLYGQWQKQWRGSNRVSHKGQHVRPADEKSMNELFKYFAKLIVNKSFFPKQMDVIFQAMKGKRAFQPIGGLVRSVSEDVEEIQAEHYADIQQQTEIWMYESFADIVDYFSASGERLTGAKLSPGMAQYINGIENSTGNIKSPSERLKMAHNGK